MVWWNRDAISRKQIRSTILRHFSERLMAGDRQAHSCEGVTLPYMLEALEAAGKPYILRALPNYSGYELSTVPEPSRAEIVEALEAMLADYNGEVADAGPHFAAEKKARDILAALKYFKTEGEDE